MPRLALGYGQPLPTPVDVLQAKLGHLPTSQPIDDEQQQDRVVRLPHGVRRSTPASTLFTSDHEIEHGKPASR